MSEIFCIEHTYIDYAAHLLMGVTDKGLRVVLEEMAYNPVFGDMGIAVGSYGNLGAGLFIGMGFLAAIS